MAQEGFREITKHEKIKLGEEEQQKNNSAKPFGHKRMAPSSRDARGGEGSTMESKHIANGFMDVCGRLGTHPELAETSLSAAGDARWKSGHMIDFHNLVDMRARTLLRNRKSGARPPEEYGVPLIGADKLSVSGAPELVHTKGDGLHAFMKSLERQPLTQLAKTVPHGLRQSKLFEALIQHSIPMPRALWLIKIIYLNRTKSPTERMTVWTKDLCQYVGELLREGFTTQPAPNVTSSGRSSGVASEREIREKWNYIVALVKWSDSANVLDQELLLTTIIEYVEKSRESFGMHRVATVVSKLLPILTLFVSFATRMHSLTGRLANVCTSILRHDDILAASGMDLGLKGGATLDDHSVAVVFDILRGLLVSSPDAFLVQKIELPTMDELRDRYPRMQIPRSFADSVEYVRGRVESLRSMAAPAEISQRRLDVILLLDRSLAGGDPIEAERYVATCQALRSSSSDQGNALRALVHIVCEWATMVASGGAPSTRRQNVASALLKNFQQALKKQNDNKGSSTTNQVVGQSASTDVVEEAAYSWIQKVHDNDPDDYDDGAFIERSELVLALFRHGVSSLDGLTSRLIVDGTMEDVKRQNLIIFYTALLFRIRHCSGKERSAMKNQRATIAALIQNARATLHIVRGRKRKLDGMDESFPIDENALNEQVSALITQTLKSDMDLTSVKSALTALNRWHFASQYVRAALETADCSNIIFSIGVLRTAGFVEPIIEFLEALLQKDINRGVILSHLLSFRDVASKDIAKPLQDRLTSFDADSVSVLRLIEAQGNALSGAIPYAGNMRKLVEFCHRTACSLQEFASTGDAKPSGTAISLATLLSQLVTHGHVPLEQALRLLVPFQPPGEHDRVRSFWLSSLLAHPVHMLPIRSEIEVLAIDAAKESLTTDLLVEAVSFLAAAVLSSASGTDHCNSAASTLNEPLRQALLRVKSLHDTIKALFSRSALNISPSSVSLIILKALNGNSSVDVTHADRACDLLSALNISRLSFQVAELRVLRELLMETAEEAVRNKYKKVVAGAKEEAMHAVHDQLSKSVLKASCHSPASIVLVAEVVVSLDVKLANVTLQKLRSEPGYDDEGHLLLSLLTLGGPALQLHIGQTIKHCILQLDSLCADEEKQAFLERSVPKELKLLLPLLGFVLGNKNSRQELCFVLFKLLSLPGVSKATDVLVVFFCILVGGGAPPWHAFSKLKQTVPVLPFSFPTETGGLRRSTRARLEAGVNLSRSFADGASFDPWTLVDGGKGTGATGKAAAFLQGSIRVPRSDSLT